MSTQNKDKKILFQEVIKRVIIILGVKLFIVFSILLHSFQQKHFPEACYQNSCFQLEIAATPEERELGLMFRKSLPKDQGMLFIFEKSDFWTFWMRNTLIPLDIIRLDKENRIVDFISAPPCTEIQCPNYVPKAEAAQAIELNSGTITQLGLQIGEKIEIKK